MLSAILDTNVFIAGLLSTHARSASRELVDRHLRGDFTLFSSPEAMLELAAVLSLPKLLVVHGLSIEQIHRLSRALESARNTRLFEVTTVMPPSITRDATDTKWLALAVETDADYLVSLDRRHLLRLKTVHRTKLVTPRAFLNALNRSVHG